MREGRHILPIRDKCNVGTNNHRKLTVLFAEGPAKNTWLTLTMQLTFLAANSVQSDRSQLPLVLVQRSGCFQLFWTNAELACDHAHVLSLQFRPSLAFIELLPSCIVQ